MTRIDKHHADLQIRPYNTREQWPAKADHAMAKHRADGAWPIQFKCHDCGIFIFKPCSEGNWPTCSNCYSDNTVATDARLWFFHGVPR